MRTLNIEMSKAAKDRLNLLKNLDTLPLPLDKENLRPFDFAFTNHVMCVLFEGAKIAFVPDEYAGKSFPLFVALAPDERVDAALKRFFEKVTDHLDVIGRLQREEKRAEKALRDERNARAEARVEQKVAEDMKVVASLWTQPTQVMSGPRITEEDFEAAARFTGEGDAFSLTSGYRHDVVVRGIHSRMNVTFADGNMVVHTFVNLYGENKIAIDKFTAQGLVFDEGKLRAEIIRMRDRNNRIHAAGKARAFIQSLNGTDYKVESFVMGTTGGSNIFDRTFGDVQVRAAATAITFLEEGCPIYAFSPAYFNEGQFPKTPSEALVQKRFDLEEYLFNDAEISAIGNLMIAGLAEVNPDVDFTQFREVGVDTLLAEVDNTDIGYNL